MGIREFVLQRAKDEGIEIGIQKGIETVINKKNLELVTNLLTMTDLTIDKIANIANVTLDFVENVKASL